MKLRSLVLVAATCLTGCSLIWTPSSTVKKFMAAAERGDAGAMTQLFSSRAVQRDGIEKIKDDNRNFAQMSQNASSRRYRLTSIKESKEAGNARVVIVFQSADGIDSLKMVFALSKEGGAWKIDNIGGPELEDIPDLASPALKDPTIPKPQAVETPPPLDSSTSPEFASPLPIAPRAPISGGVLNGRAINLPKPAYPPIAKAAKASGTVVVQVLVDEDGNVVSAHAISGHPLLQAAAIAAARSAKFSPTKLSGQPVKVTGVVTFNFVAE